MPRRRTGGSTLASRAAALGAALVACPAPTTPPPSDGEPFPRCADADPLRIPLFGDLHVHTALSLDANTQATRLGPEDAWRFARGEAVGIQPYGDDGLPLRTVRLDRPLDFAAITDHAEFLGTIGACLDSASAVYSSPGCVLLRDDPATAFLSLNALTGIQPANAAPPALCGDGGVLCDDAAGEVWGRVVAAAEAAYDRSEACDFTALVGYEWSGGPGTKNLHRNVIFRNADVPARAVSYFDEPLVPDLWAALRDECQAPCDVLTIPHNSNLSDGLMFDGVETADPALSADRAAMEPLVEVYQHKGDSECRPGDLSADEDCAFEKLPYNTLSGANLGIRAEATPLDFVRAVVGEGLRFEGVNPYRYGFIASTDTHLGTPGLVAERAFPGHGGAGHPNRTAADLDGLPDDPYFSPGGLVGVWAVENSREGVFQALRRREAWGTSGPRITVRFFGGDLPDDLCNRGDAIAAADAAGVPMGGTLRGGRRFFALAEADPGTDARPLVGLGKLQLVKVWLDGDTVRDTVIDLATAADGLDADATCAPPAAPASLCAVWDDPGPDVPALWYVRALEVPTCRWTTEACLAAGVTCGGDVPDGYEACCDPDVPRTVRERAWSSPIWAR